VNKRKELLSVAALMAMWCMMLSGCAGNASTDGEAHSGASVESSGESVTTSVENTDAEDTEITIDEPVDINEANFPDEAFRNYIKETFDADSDNVLTSLDVSQRLSPNCEW